MRPCATLQGKNAWKFASGFSWTLPHAPFPFADLNLSSFALINLRIREKKSKTLATLPRPFLRTVSVARDLEGEVMALFETNFSLLTTYSKTAGSTSSLFPPYNATHRVPCIHLAPPGWLCGT